MRLLLVTTDFPPEIGGTQTYASEIASRLCQRISDFAVVAPYTIGCEEFDRRTPYRIHRVPGSANVFPVRARSIIARLGKSQGFSAAFCVSWVAALAVVRSQSSGGPTRIFCAAHGRELLFNPWRFFPIRSLYPYLRAYTLRRVQFFFPVSRYTGSLLRDAGIPSDRMEVLGNGTDPDRFFPEEPKILRKNLNPNGDPIVLTICRLVPRKGVDTLITALPRLLESVPNVRLLVGGTGPDRTRLEQLASESGVSNRVVFLGSIPYRQLRSYYNLCNVFVLAARQLEPDVEGFGIVFLEAGACGKPVVGTRSGGIPDAVIEDQTGILVDSDRPDELAAAVARILGNSELSDTLGNAGRQHVVSRANWSSVVDHLHLSLLRIMES